MLGLGWTCLYTGQPTLRFWKALSPLFNSWVAGFVPGDLPLWPQVTLTTADCSEGGQLTEAELLCIVFYTMLLYKGTFPMQRIIHVLHRVTLA